MSNTEIIVIGYWRNEPRKTFVKNCIIGVWNEESNDDHIFFYFDSEQTVLGDHGDFIIMEYSFR